jgi:superfamily II DNA or RNA helicase
MAKTQALRPYQQAARDAIHTEWENGHARTLLVLPTGTGKTIVFASVAADKGGIAQYIAHDHGVHGVIELLEQAADKLQRSTGLVSAVEKAESTCLDSWFRVVVGSVQTLQRTARLERFPQDYFGTIIIDEAHHAITDGYRRILDYFSGAKVLGVTATPDRGDMRNLGEVFDSLAYEYKLTDAIKEGYLCKIMAQTIPLQLDISSVTLSGGDYAVADLGTALDPYLEQIAAEMAVRCKGRKTVVFLPLIRTSQKFRDLLNAHGFRAAEVNGQSDDRRQVLADFDAGKYNVLCNSMLLTEGWDCPSVDCVVVLRPTKVRSLYSQMVGRGTRLSPGKTDLLLLDFLWMTDRHELCRPADLVCEDRAVARQMTEHLAETGCPEDIEQAAAQASEDVVAQREEALAKQLEEQRRKKAKLVDPLQYEMSIQAEDLAGYVPAFGWEAGPPSEQQTAALEKLGILPDAVESAGKAALLLDRLNKRRDEGLTTPKQIRCLEKYGFQHVGTWSFEAARHMIDRIAAQGWRGVPKGVNPRTYTPAAEPPAADSPFDFGW